MAEVIGLVNPSLAAKTELVKFTFDYKGKTYAGASKNGRLSTNENRCFEQIVKNGTFPEGEFSQFYGWLMGKVSEAKRAKDGAVNRLRWLVAALDSKRRLVEVLRHDKIAPFVCTKLRAVRLQHTLDSEIHATALKLAEVQGIDEIAKAEGVDFTDLRTKLGDSLALKMVRAIGSTLPGDYKVSVKTGDIVDSANKSIARLLRKVPQNITVEDLDEAATDVEEENPADGAVEAVASQLDAE